MGAVAAIKGGLAGNITKTGEIWKEIETYAVGKASILKVNDNLYLFDDPGKLWVVNAKTGEQVGTKQTLGTINFASPLYADGHIYYGENNGRFYVLTPDASGAVRITRQSGIQFPQGDQCWASPVVSHGRLYVLTTGALYCFEDKSKTHGSTPRPPALPESDVSADQKPAHVQVVPCELLLRPGDKQKLTVKLFNSKGQFLKESPAEFALSGPGKVESGEYVAPSGKDQTATYVTAKVGDLTGRSRIRVVPPLPWKFDFEGLTDAPITWVGARYRHVMRQVDGSNTMVKITTIPLGTRSRLSMGQPDLHDYTVQTDFKVAVNSAGKLPDVGAIAQGYTLEVSGDNKWIKLMSWLPHDKRAFKELPFDLKPNTWYTIQLRAENSAGKAFLRGKIWERGKAEPKDWTIELVDPAPNKTGAPGLFGNATNAELFLDNVSVTPNS
jgi:hypothetical protein